jgi:membrane protein
MRRSPEFISATRAFLARWSESHCTSRAAALSFYSVFSLAPILVIILTVGSTFVDTGLLGNALLAEVERLIGSDGRVLVAAMLETARQRTSGSYAIIAVIVVLVGATTAFAELKDALDDILRAGIPEEQSLWQTIRTRLLSFGLVLTLAFLLLVALIANAAIRAATSFAATRMGWESSVLLGVASETATIAGAFLLFFAIFSLLPEPRLSRYRSLLAALLTTGLFTLGRIGIGAYLGHSNVALVFGAAGSLAIVLLWVYYAALTFLAGAVLASVLPETGGQVSV